MTRTPPLLPEETLARVLRLARFDGLGVLVFAGFFAILSALAGDKIGAIFGLLIAGAGAIELHGASLLMHAERRGMPWLVVSQLYLMLTMLIYCRYCLSHINLPFWHQFLAPVETELKQQGKSVDETATLMNASLFMIIAAVTVAYQGTMAVYYIRRRRPVAQAIENAESP